MNKPTAEQVLAHDWPLSLDRDFEGSCALNVIEGEGVNIEVHCQRTGHWCGCEFSQDRAGRLAREGI